MTGHQGSVDIAVIDTETRLTNDLLQHLIAVHTQLFQLDISCHTLDICRIHAGNDLIEAVGRYVVMQNSSDRVGSVLDIGKCLIWRIGYAICIKHFTFIILLLPVPGRNGYGIADFPVQMVRFDEIAFHGDLIRLCRQITAVITKDHQLVIVRVRHIEGTGSLYSRAALCQLKTQRIIDSCADLDTVILSQRFQLLWGNIINGRHLVAALLNINISSQLHKRGQCHKNGCDHGYRDHNTKGRYYGAAFVSF